MKNVKFFINLFAFFIILENYCMSDNLSFKKTDDISFEVPILFIIFNRPETTQIVFNQIKKVKPKQLFIAADGPRINKEKDYELCQKTREITKKIDWNCEVKYLFQEQNLGCGKAVSKAISWFFEHVEEGIIIEDDCLPSISFFKFCKSLLAYYRYNNQVFHIGGFNCQGITSSSDDSNYYFSQVAPIWGWATWKRAWRNYDFNMKNFNSKYLSNLKLGNACYDKIMKSVFKNIIDLILIKKELDTWDHQWILTIIQNKGLCIVPNKSLISNIGFGPTATHTFTPTNNLNFIQAHDLPEVIIHPQKICPDYEKDRTFFEIVFDIPFKKLSVNQDTANQGCCNEKPHTRINYLTWVKTIDNPKECFYKGHKLYFFDEKHSYAIDMTMGEINQKDALYNFEKYKFNKNDIVIDLGANVGIFSIILAKLNPQIQIYAYEASPVNFLHLTRNINLNNIKNIKAFNFAVADSSDRMLKIFDSSLGGYSGGGTLFIKTPLEFMRSFLVKTISLDDILVRNSIKECKLLKIDCEGSEYNILPNSTFLQTGRIRNMVGEFHSHIWGESIDQFFKSNKKMCTFESLTDLCLKNIPGYVDIEYFNGKNSTKVSYR